MILLCFLCVSLHFLCFPECRQCWFCDDDLIVFMVILAFLDADKAVFLQYVWGNTCDLPAVMPWSPYWPPVCSHRRQPAITPRQACADTVECDAWALNLDPVTQMSELPPILASWTADVFTMSLVFLSADPFYFNNSTAVIRNPQDCPGYNRAP